jgi:uncharacterized protein (TIGR03437 family)
MALLGAAAVPLRGATLARYPYLQNMRRDGATITWSTLEAGRGTVQYSTDASYSLEAVSRVAAVPQSRTGLSYSYYLHRADLTGLQQGTEYHYRVTLDGAVLPAGADLRFRTAGRSDLTFLALGDSGMGGEPQAALARQMAAENAALLVHTGDVVYPAGGHPEYETMFFEPYAELLRRVPLFPCLGNHDYYTGDGAPYLELHSVPTDGVPEPDRGRYYSFDAGNVHFVSIDSNTALNRGPVAAARMLQWLDNDLARSREFWRVVYFHHPPYASGPNDQDPVSQMARNDIVPVLEKHGVELVLNGHEHSYQRTAPLKRGQRSDAADATIYVTTGGGGAVLYPNLPRDYHAGRDSCFHYVRVEVAGGRLTASAVKLGGEIADRFTLSPPPIAGAQAAANSASYTAALAPGGLVSLFGRRLAVQEAQATRTPLPTSLGGTTVTINGRRLPLFYVSATQINAQLPFDMLGRVTLVVTTPNGSVEIPAEVGTVAPAIFVFPSASGATPAVVHANGALVSDAAPARPSEILTVYMTGLGRVGAELVEGQPAPFGPAMLVEHPVEVRIGAASVTPLFAGLAPGYAGLYQVSFRVPVDAATGTVALEIVVDGISSNRVALAVRA